MASQRLLTLLLLPVLAAEAGDADRLLAGLAERNGKLATLRARYVQRRESELSAEPLRSEGVLCYSRKAKCLVFLGERPRKVAIRLDETSYQVYRPAQRRAERWEFRRNFSGAALLELFSPGVAKLTASYDTLELKREGEVATVRLRPKEERVLKRIRELRLALRNETFELVRFAYRDADGELVSIELSRIETNPKLPEATFAKEPPKGTDLRITEVKD